MSSVKRVYLFSARPFCFITGSAPPPKTELSESDQESFMENERAISDIKGAVKPKLNNNTQMQQFLILRIEDLTTF